jgi:hypothetical protein
MLFLASPPPVYPGHGGHHFFRRTRNLLFSCPEIKKLFVLYKKMMNLLLSSLMLLCFAIIANGQSISKQDAEKIVNTYYSGFVKKDWNITASQLADGFTFSSPAGDDYMPVPVYQERCFQNSKLIRKFNLVKLMVDGNNALIIYEITTMNNKMIRNVEYWTFCKDKVKSIECFFGGTTGAGYPLNVQDK